MRYIGIDLAWGARNTTAVFALASAGDAPTAGAAYLAHADALTDNAAITDFVAACDDGGGLLIAVDAPTLVPNETGRRPCEDILSRCLRRVEAGPHPANRRLLGDADAQVRGETLVALLAARLGVSHTPYFAATEPRAVFEAFPHPAHVALFGLEKTLKYKAKPGRTKESRHGEFRRYAAFLEALRTADPPLLLAPAWECTDPAAFATEALLKRYEDTLDALTCAYVALHRHRWGDERSAVVGDLVRGYVVTPATEEMRDCFALAPPI